MVHKAFNYQFFYFFWMSYNMNDIIIKEFEILLKQIRIQMNRSSGKEFTRHSFRLSSLSKALNIIKNMKKKITSHNDIKDIKGIGKGTIDRVKEILESGKLKEIKIKGKDNTYIKSIDNLVKIFGIGKKKAHELVMKHDVKDIQDLKKLIKNKKIQLPDNIIKGLKYVDKTKTGIPREEIDETYVYLIQTVLEFDRDLNLLICGSYRRLKPKSNDIDVILYHNKIDTKSQAEKSNIMKNFIKVLVKNRFIVDNYTSYDVPTKFMGLCRYNKKPLRRIDIRMIPKESLHAATLYFTGSGDFNKKMRKIALDMGYTLNEYGIYDSKGKSRIIKSEKDIFDILNMEYLPPHLRK